MRVFGERGIAASSLRDVAKAAGVSAALIVHHFGSRDGLIAATDEAALREFGEAYYRSGEDLADRGTGTAAGEGRADGEVMRERRDVCVYLGRALVEATPGSARLFRLMIEGGRAEVGALAERGALREDTDLLWATLQHFFLIWAPLSFTALLEQEVLEGSLLDEPNLGRWVEANVQLLRGGGLQVSRWQTQSTREAAVAAGRDLEERLCRPGRLARVERRDQERRARPAPGSRRAGEGSLRDRAAAALSRRRVRARAGSSPTSRGCRERGWDIATCSSRSPAGRG